MKRETNDFSLSTIKSVRSASLLVVETSFMVPIPGIKMNIFSYAPLSELVHHLEKNVPRELLKPTY